MISGKKMKKVNLKENQKKIDFFFKNVGRIKKLFYLCIPLR